MTSPLILASGSAIRADMLRNAGARFDVAVPRVDEKTVRDALALENAPPRDVADTLAEMKAVKISDKVPDAMVLGADQVLSCEGRIFGKPADEDDAAQHLRFLRGKRHSLISAAVICENGKPVWRQVGVAILTMHDLSDSYIHAYVARNWDSIRHSVGGYKIEEEGVQLFSKIDGEYFNILGLPLIQILSYLRVRDMLPK